MIISKKQIEEIWNISKNYTLLDKERYIYLLDTFLKTIDLKGDIIEFGVYKGGVSLGIAFILQKLKIQKKIHLVDTFEGIPSYQKLNNDFDKYHEFKDYSFKEVKELFSNFNNIVFHKGEIPKILKEINTNYFSFAHIDLNYFLPTFHSLEFLLPKILPKIYIVIDDYGFPLYADTVKKAVDNFIQKYQPKYYLKFESVNTGQAVICMELNKR